MRRWSSRLLALLLVLLGSSTAWAVWDSTKPAQTQTVSVGMDATQQNFAALEAGTATLTGITGDFSITDTSPHLMFCDSSDSTAYTFHLDTLASDPYRNFQLWRGTCSGQTFTVGPNVPLMYFDNANQVHFPGGISQSDGVDVSTRVYKTTSQSIPNATYTAVTFDAERFDTNALHSTTSFTDRITVPETAKYFLWANIEWAANTVGIRNVFLRVNGSLYIAEATQSANSADTTIHSISTYYALTANDYVEVMVYQSSTGALNILNGVNYSPEFAAVKLP